MKYIYSLEIYSFVNYFSMHRTTWNDSVRLEGWFFISCVFVVCCSHYLFCRYVLGNVSEGFKITVEILPHQAVLFDEPERLGSVVDRAGLGWAPLVSGDAGMIDSNLFH